MIVQSTSALFTAANIVRSPSFRQTATASTANAADTVSISQSAQDAFAAATASPDSTAAASADQSVETRLAAIKAKDAQSRTDEDWNTLFANDQKLAEITAKGNQSPGSLTAEEIDYEQKARGFVNTMANLSPAEKALHDKAVASGNTAAAEGVSLVAFVRMMGHTAGGANGTTYDPLGTEITAANIQNYFSHSINDPSGQAQSHFQALAQYLRNNPAV